MKILELLCIPLIYFFSQGCHQSAWSNCPGNICIRVENISDFDVEEFVISEVSLPIIRAGEKTDYFPIRYLGNYNAVNFRVGEDLFAHVGFCGVGYEEYQQGVFRVELDIPNYRDRHFEVQVQEE